MALLYLAGVYINPGFFGSGNAVSAILRDTARFGVMAVGVTFVIVNKDLDLAVGTGVSMGLLNGWLVTVMLVPSFIATLTMLFIGRGLVLGMTGGKTIAYEQKSVADPWFFQIGETNALGFNNQIL